MPFDHPAGFETAAQFPGAIIEAYRGKAPCISADACIAPGAAVIGDVTVGSQANIWDGCMLQGNDHYIRVGARSNIQDGTVVRIYLHKHPTANGLSSMRVSLGLR